MITTVLNRADLIGEALSSVADQIGADVEHIVIDAGSTDGTLEILARHPSVRMINLPRSTPEEALNEGIRLAQGEIIGFIMSDDRLSANILPRIAAMFEADPNLDIVSAGAVFFANDKDGRDIILQTFRRRPVIDLNYRVVLLGPLMVCARFYRRRLFERVGAFGDTYRTCNDRDFLWRAMAAGCTNACLEAIAYWYRSHPGSKSVSGANIAGLIIAEDHMDMAENYLADATIAEDHRRALRRFHAVEALRAAVRASKAGDGRRAIANIIRAFKVSLFWPVVALVQVLELKLIRATMRD